MNQEDYLWDRSGEPDPEIKELEEILGTLRYQPQPLEIPAGLQVGRRQNFFRDFGPRLAIAATIVMLLLGLGVWVGLQRLQRQRDVIVKTPAPSVNGGKSPAPSPSDNPNPNLAIFSPSPDEKLISPPRRRRINESALAKTSTSRPRNTMPSTELARNQQEGEAAKDKLMLALRMASMKLSVAQKKMQGVSPRDIIHNQHKIG